MTDRFDVFHRYRPLIDDWDAFVAALSRPLPVCVWSNPLRTTPGRLERWMRAGGLHPRPLGWLDGAWRLPEEEGPGARFEYVAGLYHVQEEVSLVPPVLLDPRPGERVLDLCAAPGGKTAQIALAMDNRGTVVANDRHRGRLTSLRATLDRLGVINVTTTAEDGGNYPPEGGLFDRVLADVPCTCEGTSRKSPEVLGQVDPAYAEKMSGVQTALLRKAVQVTRPGGRIVYSTCTYAPEENERVVGRILAEQGEVLQVVPARVEGLRTEPGLTRWRDEDGREERYPDQMAGALRIWPHHNDTGGFFVAVLEKTGTTGSEPGETPPVEERPGLMAVDPEGWRPYLQRRFGIPDAAWESYHVLRRNTQMLGVVAPGHRPPPRPEPQSVGMPFLYPHMRYPKLTTVAARLLAPAMERNRLELDRSQADDYLRRRTFELLPQQAEAVTGPGYVLASHGGFPLGLGVARWVEEGKGRMELESMSPKRFAEAASGEVLPGLVEEPAGEGLWAG